MKTLGRHIPGKRRRDTSLDDVQRAPENLQWTIGKDKFDEMLATKNESVHHSRRTLSLCLSISPAALHNSFFCPSGHIVVTNLPLFVLSVL